MSSRFVKNIFVFVSLSLILSCSSLLKPRLKVDWVDVRKGNYSLDKSHSVILFKVSHLGFSKFVGRFNAFDASLNFDAQNIENSSLEAVIDMTSVDVNNEDFEATLKSRFWFDTEAYPQAVFSTRSAQKTDDNTMVFQGDLTFLGVTKNIQLNVNFNGAATNLLTQKYTLGFEASSTFQRSEFGLDNYIPAVGDDIELEIHAEFQKQ